MEDYKEKIISLMEGNELTDEEKAKLRKAFPELVESEDEKIRKRIIAFLRSPFVMNDIADDIIAPWIAYLEKVKDFEKQLERAYKRGYDDYLEGIANAKKELEKQGEMDIEMDIEKPITIGKRRVVSGKLKELIDNKDPKSIEETKEKMLAETSNWTEEDERLFNSVYNTLEGIAPLSYEKELDWLKSIKERLQ